MRCGLGLVVPDDAGAVSRLIRSACAGRGLRKYRHNDHANDDQDETADKHRQKRAGGVTAGL